MRLLVDKVIPIVGWPKSFHRLSNFQDVGEQWFVTIHCNGAGKVTLICVNTLCYIHMKLGTCRGKKEREERKKYIER